MNNHPKKTIIKRRCDIPMKRSKERTRCWKCNKDCRNCFCCIEMDNGEYEEHVDIRRVRKDEGLPKDKEQPVLA